MNLANEGLEARKKDEEVASRKRKAEEDKQWEGMLIVPPHVTSTDLLANFTNRPKRGARRQLAEFLQHEKEEKDQGANPWINLLSLSCVYQTSSCACALDYSPNLVFLLSVLISLLNCNIYICSNPSLYVQAFINVMASQGCVAVSHRTKSTIFVQSLHFFGERVLYRYNNAKADRV